MTNENYVEIVNRRRVPLIHEEDKISRLHWAANLPDMNLLGNCRKKQKLTRKNINNLFEKEVLIKLCIQISERNKTTTYL